MCIIIILTPHEYYIHVKRTSCPCMPLFRGHAQLHCVYVRGRPFIGNNASWGHCLLCLGVFTSVFTSDCCVGSSAPMVVHVLDCRRGFEHLTGCKWRHARYIRCRLQRCCLLRVIHALPISHGKGGVDSITYIVLWLWRYGFRYLCVNAAVGIGISCSADTLARAAGQVKREH